MGSIVYVIIFYSYSFLTEIRELESTVRLSDRKLFKSWEALKEAAEAAAFEPLLDEIKV